MAYDPTLPDDLEAHADWLRRLARSLLRDAEDAEDLAQETWVVALESRSRQGAPDRPWLAGVLRNLARFRLRSDVRRRAREQQAARPSGPTSESDPLERIEQFRLLADSVESLQDPDRSIVILRYFDGLSSDEIGARLGLSAGAVRMRLKRALESLRERLDREQTDWRAALAPLLWPIGAPQGAGAGSGSTMATTTGLGIAVSVQRIVAIVFVVALGVVAWQWDPWEWRGASSGEARSGATAESSSEAVDADSAQAEPSAGLAAAETPPEPESYAWIGVVRDRFTGEPIEGAVVSARESLYRAALDMARSDSDGVYRFRRLPFNAESLMVRHPRFLTAYASVHSGQRDFQLSAGAPIVGRVIDDETEEPLTNGLVLVCTPAHDSSRSMDPVFAESPIDSDGRFALAVGTSIVVLEANVPNYRPVRSAPVILDPATTTDVVLRARRAPSRPGRVTDPDGAPIADARVEYVPDFPGGEYVGQLTRRPRRSVMTDAAGEFVMQADPGHVALLNVDAEGFVGFRGQYVDPGLPARIVLEPGQAVELRIDSESPGPISGDARLRLPNGWRLRLEPRESGAYRTTWFEAGIGRACIELAGFEPLSVEWPSGPGLHDLGPVRLQEAPTFDLRVVDESGIGIAGARISTPSGGFECDSEGRVELPRTGPYEVTVSALGYVETQYKVDAQSGDDVRVTLSRRAASLTGQVVDSGGAPILGASVRLPKEVASRKVHATDALGRFHVETVPAGDGFTIVVSHFEHETMTVSVPDLASGAALDLGLIVLGDGSTVSGVVVDEAGAPIRGARVQVYSPHRPQDSDTPLGFSDTRGRFELRGLPPGEHFLAVDAEGYEGQDEPLLVVTHTPVPTVVLRKATSYRARVVDVEGEPVPYAYVWYLPRVDHSMQYRSRKVKTNWNGYFELRGIPRDRPSLRVSIEFMSTDHMVSAPTVDELPDTIVVTREARLTLRFSDLAVDVFELRLERLDRSSTRGGGGRAIAGVASVEVPPGPYRVSVVDRESGRSSSPVEVVAKAGEEVAVDVVFDEAAFEISVVDPRGSPVSGAKLHVLRVLSNEKHARMRGAASGETNADGILSCASFEAPAMVITVDPPAGLARCERRLSLPGGKPTDVRIALDHELRLELQVATEIGEALVDGSVRMGRDGAVIVYPDHRGKTDAAGRVVFGELESGTYDVTIDRADGLLLKRFELEVGADHPEVREITVPMPFDVDGRILLNGEPADGGRVFLESSSTSAQVTAAGAFRITALSEDDTVLEYRIDDDVSARQAIAPRRDGGEVRLEFRTVEVRGIVVDSEGQAVPNARVRIEGPTGEVTLRTGEDGRFELSRVPPGRYTGRTWIDGKRVGVQSAVEIDGGAELRVTLERTE